MHHLFLILTVLALVLLYVFLPWQQALPWSVGVLGIFLAILIWVNRKQSARAAGAPMRPMIGSKAIVVKARNKDGKVRWQGEIWHAVSSQPLSPGEEVIIEKVDGLTLTVRSSTPE